MPRIEIFEAELVALCGSLESVSRLAPDILFHFIFLQFRLIKASRRTLSRSIVVKWARQSFEFFRGKQIGKEEKCMKSRSLVGQSLMFDG